MMPEQEEFAKLTAIVIHALIYKDVGKRFPSLPAKEQDQLMVDIIQRVALLRGYTLRLNGRQADHDED